MLIPKLEMKFLLTICLLLISTVAGARVQQSGRHHATTLATKTLRQTALTRSQSREAERRLSDLGYWTGAVDGRFDPATRSALIAFQKWEGRPITGQLTLDELDGTSHQHIAQSQGSRVCPR